MGRVRTLSQKNPYYIPQQTYLTCKHYALQYRDWKASIDADRDTRGAIRYDKDRVQVSNDYDSTAETAIRLAEYGDKCRMIEKVIDKACGYSSLNAFLKLGVCYGFTFNQLKAEGMPCERKLYYQIRRRFYFELAKKI